MQVTVDTATPLTSNNADERAIAAAAQVNGWTMISVKNTDTGGRRLIYAKDCGHGYKAATPAIMAFTLDAAGRVIRYRRDVARRTFVSEGERTAGDERHGFDFADAAFRCDY